MNDFDFSEMNLFAPNINMDTFSSINEDLEHAQRVMAEVGEQNAKKDNALFEMAKASIAQKELLEEQLQEVKEQNAQLKENNRLLNEMYEKAKKEAKENKVFGWISLGVGAFIGITGIVLGIIF